MQAPCVHIHHAQLTPTHSWPQILVQVTNEEAVLEAIRGVLSERARGEELVLFDPVSLSGAGLQWRRPVRACISICLLLVLSVFPTRATAAG